MSEIRLFKKKGTYVDKKDGKEKAYTNFYVRCGDSLIPVQVCYFENEEGRDPQYAARRAVMSAFAEPLPERAAAPLENEEAKSVKAEKNKGSTKSKTQPLSDEEQIPF